MKKKSVIAVIVVLTVVCLCAGVGIGYLSASKDNDDYEEVINQIEESYNEELEESEPEPVQGSVSSEEIESSSSEETTGDLDYPDIVVGEDFDKYASDMDTVINLTDKEIDEIMYFFYPIASYPYTGDIEPVEKIKDKFDFVGYDRVMQLYDQIDTSKTIGAYEYNYDNIHVYAGTLKKGNVILDIVFTGKDPETPEDLEDWVYKKDMNIRVVINDNGLIDIYHISLAM